MDRLNRDPDYVRNPAISMIISAQPTVLSDIMQNGMLDGRGFLARLFYVNVAGASFSRAFRSSPIPQELKDDYRKLIFSLLDIPSDQMITLHLTPEAVTRMDKLCNEMESDLRKYHRDMREWGSKFIGLALRIAGLLHVADGLTDDIGENHIGCAITIGRYALQHAMPEVKDPKTKSSKRIVPAADRLKKVLDAIDRKSGFYLCGKDGETPLSYSEARRSFEKIRKAFDLQDYTAHDFRDTCATEWRENGMNIDLIAKILGHANSKITEQRYVKYREDMMDEAKKKMELTSVDS